MELTANILARVNSAELDDLVRQWNDRAAVVVSEANGVALAFPTDLLATLLKILPVIIPLLTSFTPAGLLALLPAIIAIVFPKLDPKLGELLAQILSFLIGK